jgi:hypothetical protein
MRRYIRRAKALGYEYEGRLRGLLEPAKAGFVAVARPFTGRAGLVMRQQWQWLPRWLPIIAILAAILSACGGSGITQTSQTQRYQLQLTLDGLGFGQRTATIEVRDSGGQPVAADQVVLAPVMQQMGMASPEIVAQSVAPGRYQAQGEFFSMLGQWEIDVRVSAGGAEDVGRFIVQVDQS